MSATYSLPFPGLPSVPDYSIETRLRAKGCNLIAGVDEAGRGPLAGPVVAAAVILDPANIPDGLNDSKKLTHKRRETVFDTILKVSCVSWSSIPPSVIDRINIRSATLLAMTVSVKRLSSVADAVLIDGRDVPTGLTGIGEAFIKGDARSLSIAAASIVAKVVRDRMMVAADSRFPEFGFAGHKGYGVLSHREAILRHGPCPLHRRSFSPVKDMLS